MGIKLNFNISREEVEDFLELRPCESRPSLRQRDFQHKDSFKIFLTLYFLESQNVFIGWGRYTGNVTDDKFRPVEVKVYAKRPILAILGL